MNAFNTSDIVCTLIAIVSIVSALLVVAQAVHNPVNSVLWLIVSFVAVACYLITAGITFLGLSYIIVYVGAIAVLFLFVVMMLNLANQGIADEAIQGGLSHNKMWPVAIIILIIGTLAVLPLSQHITFVVDIPIAIIDIIHNILYAGNQSYDVINVDTTAWYTSVSIDHQVSPLNQVQILGITLYTHGALWLIIVSVLLILAIIVPLALAFTA